MGVYLRSTMITTWKTNTTQFTDNPLMMGYIEYLQQLNLSKSTVEGYTRILNNYFRWFSGIAGRAPWNLFRENVLEYRTFLLDDLKKNAKTVNIVIGALVKFNEYLIKEDKLKEYVVSKNDFIKVTTSQKSPTRVNEAEVQEFIQKIK